MKNLKIIFIFMAIILVSNLFAEETGNLAGIVFKLNHTKVPFARVFVKGTGLSAETDKNGEFLIEDIPVGRYSVSCRKKGFIRFYKHNVDIYPDLTNFISIKFQHIYQQGTSMCTLYNYKFKQLAKISGTVFDQDFSVISDAKVLIKNTDLQNITDKYGKYEFVLYTEGSKELIVSTDDYPDYSYKFDVTSNNSFGTSRYNVDVFLGNEKIVIDSTFLNKKKQGYIKWIENIRSPKNKWKFFGSMAPKHTSLNSKKFNINHYDFDYPIPKENSISIFNEAGINPRDDESIFIRIGIQSKNKLRMMKKKNFVFIIEIKELEKHLEYFNFFKHEFYKFIKTLDKDCNITIFLRDDYEYLFLKNIKASNSKKIIQKIDEINPDWARKFIKSKENLVKKIEKFEKEQSKNADKIYKINYNHYKIYELKKSLYKMHNEQNFDELAVKYKVMHYLYENYDPEALNLVISIRFWINELQLDTVEIIQSLKKAEEKKSFINDIYTAQIYRWDIFFDQGKTPEYTKSIIERYLFYNDIIAKDVDFTIHFNFDNQGKEVEQEKILAYNHEMKSNFQYSYSINLKKNLFRNDEIGVLKLSYIDQVSFERISINQPIILSKTVSDEFYFTSTIYEIINNQKRDFKSIIDFAEKRKDNSDKWQIIIDAINEDPRYKRQLNRKKRNSTELKIKFD